jgi:REP element-mobilizing transposase RayT
MGYARKLQVSLKDTSYYHCVARCVRRSWLYGYDKYAGKDYSHRKQWVIDRLRELSLIFAMDICAYAVMSNHYHAVLFVDQVRAKQWSEKEVIARWTKLFSMPPLIERYLKGEGTLAEQNEAKKIIKRWRKRLTDVSWFMRCLNEHLARRANLEDNCTGRFWEGRFKCQALLDEAGLLTAMAYVDLNPIRAGIAQTPEESEFTSIYERIRIMQGTRSYGPRLKRFYSKRSKHSSLPIPFVEYLQLVDWTGRQIRTGKRGSIDKVLPPILTRLNIDAEAWVAALQPKGNVFGRAMGKLNHLKLHARALGQSWIKGLKQAERLYR